VGAGRGHGCGTRRDRDGAGTGFAEFVASRGPRTLRVAWLLTGDSPLAEDLLQPALAKLWPRWPRIAADNPEAYLRTTPVP
jgi:DNA-directed RNA polymerase specialized sigma24 family protein